MTTSRGTARSGGLGVPTGPRVVVAGGGTAGHIEPALNFADALRRIAPDAAISALGTEKGLDCTLIPARGYPLELIPPVPLPRRPGRALLATPGRLAASVRVAGEVLERTRAEAVVGFGGYVATPAYLAARRRQVPIVVHEANARPGIANRLAARMTTHVFTATAAVRLPHATAIGIPLRPAIAGLDRAAERAGARAGFGLHADAPTLLVFGGSQGARSINYAVARAAPGLLAAGVQVLHLAGSKNLDDVRAALGPLPQDGPPYVLLPYVEGMAAAYAAADFALCRCGAMTCAELAAVGLPAAYVPYPVGNGEQRLNAQPVVAAGGGLLVDDADLTPDWIVDAVVPRVTDPPRLAQMSAAASHAGARDADVVLARHVLNVVAEYRHLGGQL